MLLKRQIESGVAIDGPSGRVVSHPQSHYCTMDMHLVEVNERQFHLLERREQVPPVFEGDTTCDAISQAL